MISKFPSFQMKLEQATTQMYKKTQTNRDRLVFHTINACLKMLLKLVKFSNHNLVLSSFGWFISHM